MAETGTGNEAPPKLRVSPQVLAKINAMRMQLETYMAGIADGMGLVGYFTIDEKTGVISSAPPPELPKNGPEPKT